MSDTCINHIENYWKTKTTLSNACFEQGDFDEALSGYKNALYRAEVLNNHQLDCLRLNIPFIQVYIISCNNLSNTYRELGQLEEAEKMLKRAVYYLLHLALKPELPGEEIQTELSRASLALLNFAEKSGGKKKQEKLLSDLKEQFIENRLIKANF